MKKYNIQVLGHSETRWSGVGHTKLVTGEHTIYSGHEDEDHAHTHRVAIMATQSAVKVCMEWNPVSPRIITARFKSKGRNVNVIECYASTNSDNEEAKQEFYNRLQPVLDEMPRRDIKILMGDMNAKVGSDNAGRHEIGVMNKNGELFTDICASNDLW